MATTVDKFPTVRRGRPEIYPYALWLNGKRWALKHGEDFTVSPDSLKAALYARKNKLGYEIRTVTETREDGSVYVYVQRLTGAAAASHRKKASKAKPKAKPRVKAAA